MNLEKQLSMEFWKIIELEKQAPIMIIISGKIPTFAHSYEKRFMQLITTQTLNC